MHQRPFVQFPASRAKNSHLLLVPSPCRHQPRLRDVLEFGGTEHAVGLHAVDTIPALRTRRDQIKRQVERIQALGDHFGVRRRLIGAAEICFSSFVQHRDSIPVRPDPLRAIEHDRELRSQGDLAHLTDASGTRRFHHPTPARFRATSKVTIGRARRERHAGAFAHRFAPGKACRAERTDLLVTKCSRSGWPKRGALAASGAPGYSIVIRPCLRQ